MSGLCASASFDERSTARRELEGMVAAAAHRGADGTCTWTGAGVALAQLTTRLVPGDEPDGGIGPAHGLAIVADARIDNRAELLPTLVRHGYLVDAAPVADRELVLACYRLWGAGCAARLIGDFAFVIWDDRRRTVFAARDPMGMRGLYYRWEPRRRLLLATEVAQLLAAGGVPRELHEAAAVAILAGAALPPSWTLFAGIDELPPGFVLEASADTCRTRRAYRPDPSLRFGSRDERDAADAFREVLGEAVRARLRCTKPVAIALSGGLDSGSVAALAGQVRERCGTDLVPQLRTYSWAFEELLEADERAVSDVVVRRYGMSATAVPADDWWPLAGYPDHGPDEDDPLCWPYQGLVDRTLDRCRDDGAGVVLGGDRGDEVVGDWIFDDLGLLAAGRPLQALSDVRLAGSTPWRAVRAGVLRPVARAVAPSLFARGGSGRSAVLPPWVSRDVARRTGLGDLLVEEPSGGFGGRARSERHARIFNARSARWAVQHERRCARRGLGFADPFSDRRVVELVLSVPQWMVQRRSQPKAMARAAMLGVMPEPARSAAGKTIPHRLFDRGLRQRAVPVVQDLLTGSQAAARGWLNEAAVLQAHRRYVETGVVSHDFWWPLSVEMWLRRWWS